MLRLFNIQQNDDHIFCDYEPERSGMFGKVTLDKRSREAVNVILSDYEYGKQMYLAQACYGLRKILDTNSDKTELFVQWF